MKNQSRRARRMERRHKIFKPVQLNLVSLMDIFTILVFFLLATASNSLQLPTSKDIRLPASVAQKVPNDTVIVAITEKDILVQGRRVATVEEVMAGDQAVISGLQKELELQAAGGRAQTGAPGTERAVTIMGDETLSYDLLRKVLASCQKAEYTRIAFAAIQKARERAGQG